MARQNPIKFLRTTRAALDTQSGDSGLIAGEPYLVTDEGRLAIGTSVGVYEDTAKRSEVSLLPQCALVLNGSDLELRRRNGTLIPIGGVIRTLQSSPPTLSAVGLTAGTVYYIYANWTGSSVALSASTTGTADVGGFRVRSDDSSYLLVGVARPFTGPTWVDSDIRRFVRSLFNGNPLRLLGPSVASNRSTTSTSPVEINSETRTEFVALPGDVIDVQSTGWCFSSGALEVQTFVGLDGSSSRTQGVTCYGSSGGPAASRGQFIPGEGYHYITLCGAVSGGTGTWLAGSGARDGCGVGGVIIPSR